MAPSATVELTPELALETVVRECRDLIEALIDKDIIPTAPGSTPFDEAARNRFVRDHLVTNDYGIPVSEFIPGLSEEDMRTVIDRTLSSLEYNMEQDASQPYGEG